VFKTRADHETARSILAISNDPAYGSLKVSQLRISSPIARRYSFTARPH
jgi:hypothetical protein